MKLKKLKLLTTLLLLLPLCVVLLSACNEVQYIDSETKIVGRYTDTTLNDSSLIYGIVIMNGTINMPYSNAEIWIEETDDNTASDIQGKFSLRVLPGTYTVKCLAPYNEDRFLMTLKDISLLPNEKIEIHFFHGSKSE